MEHKFKVGDKAVFTNEFGVCWGVKTIKSLENGFNENDAPRYHIEPTDTPWYPVSEKCLTLADNMDMLAHDNDQDWYFQLKYGRPTTLEERRSLLDTDPFDGEV